MLAWLEHAIAWLWGGQAHAATNVGYAIDSGPLPDVALIGGMLAAVKHLQCDAPRCLRYGPHRTADGQHRLCHTHHPDLPARRLSLAEIHARHRDAQQKETC